MHVKYDPICNVTLQVERAEERPMHINEILLFAIDYGWIIGRWNGEFGRWETYLENEQGKLRWQRFSGKVIGWSELPADLVHYI